MPKSIGRIENVGSAAEPFGVGLSCEQISDERLSAGYELVTQYVPGTYLHAAGSYKGANSPFFLGTNAEVVLDQYGLAVKEKGCVRLRLEALEEIVDRRNQTGEKNTIGEIPLPIPMCVRYEMEGVPRHRGS
jgi:hypothetical protein